MINARDVQRTFETWLALAKDQEVLALVGLVHSALRRRGYSLRCEWVNPVRSQVVDERSQEGSEDAP